MAAIGHCKLRSRSGLRKNQVPEMRVPLEMNAAIPGLMRFVVVALLWMVAESACAVEVEAHSAALLSARYEALRDQLSHNAFRKPLYLESSEIPGGVSGDVFALVDYPFSTTGTALNGPAQWCDILILHLNTKFCRVSTAGAGRVLNVGIGRKYDQPPEKAYRVDFAYRVAADTPHYLNVVLDADTGPLNTQNHRIVLEAIPLESGRTFIHMTYSYAYGLAGRLALQTYLQTLGRRKVGFTIVGTQPEGQPRYVGGLRGIVERNSMRYYLAIEAFLGALSVPPPAQFEKRLHDWFDASERYPLQLHEMEQRDYLEMKRREHGRRQSDLRVTRKLALHIRLQPRLLLHHAPAALAIRDARTYI